MFTGARLSCRARPIAAGLCLIMLACAGCGPVSSTRPYAPAVDAVSEGYHGPTEERWRATAYVRVRTERPRVLDDPQAEKAVPFDQLMQTQLAILQSPVVLQRVASDPELSQVAERSGLKNPLAWLTQHTHVAQVSNSELVTISFDALTEIDAALVTNKIVDSYVKIASDIAAHELQQLVDLLDKEMDRRTRELERLRQSVRALVKMTMAVEYIPSSRIKAAEELPVEDRPLVQLRKLLNETKRQRVALESRVEALKQRLDSKEIHLDPAEVETLVDGDAGLTELNAKLVETQREQQAAAAAAAELPSSVAKTLQDRAAELEQQISQRRQELEERIHRNLAKAEEFGRESLVGDLKLEIEAKKNLETQLTMTIEESIKEIEKQNNHAFDLEFLRQDLERSEETFKQIANRAEALKTNMRAPDRVSEFARADAAQAVKVRVPRA